MPAMYEPENVAMVKMIGRHGKVGGEYSAVL